jgi:hypothetical protein
MTTDELGPELTEKSTPRLTIAHILNLCDRILGEPARRRHLFAWLRAPGAAADEWLPVDGYYPGNKLVVVLHSSPAPGDNVYSELVPAHGFRLLELTPDQLGGDPPQAEARLRERITALGVEPQRPRESQPRQGAVARAVASLAPARPVAQTAPTESAPLAARGPTESDARVARGPAESAAAVAPSWRPAEVTPLGAGFGAVLGVVLAVVLLVEVYLGVAVVGFGHGQPLVAFAFALDACGRALGTIVAGHSGLRDWAWWCALGGSPVVAVYGTLERREQAATDPAPLAGLISTVALGIGVLGALVALASG